MEYVFIQSFQVNHKYMRIKLILSIFLFCIFFCQAQNTNNSVIDSKKNAIPYANVVLCSLDSTYISGTTTDSLGNFSLQQISDNTKLLKVSSIGYFPKWFSIPFPEKIVLQTDTNLLNEVNVIGNRKIYKLSNRGLVADVKGTILETLPNASEILPELPFVSIENGEYIVFGKGKVLIYINNHPLINDKELKQLLPKNIKSIEIITNPGAEYDATIKAVIKITTDKTAGNGLSGQIDFKITQSRRFSKYASVLLNYRYSAWDVFGGLSYNSFNQKNYQKLSNKIILNENDYIQNFEISYPKRFSGIWPRFGLNFNPNSRHSAGIQYTSEISSTKLDFENIISIYSIGMSESSILKSQTKKGEISHDINAYYIGNFTDKLSINFYSNMVIGNAKNAQNSYEHSTPNDTVENIYNKDYTLGAGKLILNYDFSNSSIRIGTEYTYTDIYQKTSINQTDLGIDNSNDHSKQNRYALFTTYQGKFRRFEVGVGLRYENINMRYYNYGVYIAEQSQRYNKFFPDLSFSYNADKYQYQIGYERKNYYPSYYQLRSSINYISPYVYETGNPYLTPNIDNDFSALFSWKTLQLMAHYLISENEIQLVPEIYKNESILVYRNINIPNAKRINLGVSYSSAFGVWRPNIELTGSKQFLLINGINYNKPILYVKNINTLMFKNDWILYFNVYAHTSGNSVIRYNNPSWNLDVKVSKALLSKKLSINIAIVDIFHTNNYSYSMNYINTQTSNHANFDTRYGYIAVYYDFNATRNKYKGQDATDEINRLK